MGRQTYRAGESYPLSGHLAGYDFKWSEGRSLSDFGIVLIESGRGVLETLRASLPSQDNAIFLRGQGTALRRRDGSRSRAAVSLAPLPGLAANAGRDVSGVAIHEHAVSAVNANGAGPRS